MGVSGRSLARTCSTLPGLNLIADGEEGIIARIFYLSATMDGGARSRRQDLRRSLALALEVGVWVAMVVNLK